MIKDHDPVETMLLNSYRDFHVKGFDYICLTRSPKYTRKVYFFDGDVSKLPEVVNPHDHRYCFHTFVLSGAVENRTYAAIPSAFAKRHGAPVYNVFDYMTPLNGGDGFTFIGEAALHPLTKNVYGPAHVGYYSTAQDIHTIQIRENNTVLVLDQYEDVVALDKPTLMFTQGNEPPSLSGLYRKWKADDLIARLKTLGIEV